MRLITVSRQSGSLGDEITDLLARSLGLAVINKGSLERTLLEHGVPETSVERFDEKKPGFWEFFSAERDRYYHYLKASILEMVATGDHIILGRGASAILDEVPGVLNLRFVAPMPVRIQRIMESHSCDEHHARRIIHETDHNRAGFHHVFFNVDWDSPDLYDIVVNTAEIPPAAIVQSIQTIVSSPDRVTRAEAAEERIGEMRIAQAILTRIIFEERIPLRFPAVEVHRGVATISGSVSVEANVERCEAAAKSVDGVEGVEMQVARLPENYDGPYM